MISFYRRWPWPEPFPWGMWAPFWVRNIDLVRETITKLKLKPIDAKRLPVQSMPAMKGKVELEISEAVFRIPPWPGGLKGPHFHHAGEVFILNDKQWAQFGGVIIDGFRKKLEGINNVTLDQVLEMDDAIAGLPR